MARKKSPLKDGESKKKIKKNKKAPDVKADSKPKSSGTSSSNRSKKRRKKRRGNALVTIILIIVMGGGLGLLLYPSVADYWNSFHQSRAIASYQEAVDNLSREEYEKLWNEAVEWNKNLAANYTGPYTLSDSEMAEYNSILDVSGTGIMGYVTIQKIRVKLPIYHGTDESKLQVAIGHLEWSSFPVGGEDTHCVISGHRGLPSAKLLTSIDRLQIGDTFMLTTLNDNLTYEVDQILVVLPEEVKDLYLQSGKDLCTLVTCTPYGVNSHRLLVRGHRIPNDPGYNFNARADATVIDPLIVAPILAVPGLVALFIWVMLQGRKGRKQKKKERALVKEEKRERKRRKAEEKKRKK